MLLIKRKLPSHREKEYSEAKAQVWRERDSQKTEQQSLEPGDLGVSCVSVTLFCDLGQVTISLSSSSSPVK